MIGYFSKKLSAFKQGLQTNRQKLEISLAISICVFLFLSFRILICHTGFGAKLGQQIYLTAPKNVPIERTIDIVMAFDDAYVQHSAATIASILLNCDATSNFRFHILDGGISESKKDKLVKLKKIRNFEIKFSDMTKYDWSMFPSHHMHTTVSTYYRLRIPDILPRNILKALYLDGDIIVEQDLKELWDIDLSDSVLGAVEDANGINFGTRFNLTRRYFNAGVLLLNLDRLRQTGSIKKIIKYVKDNRERILCNDQDILNGLFNDQYKEIPLKWNVNNIMYTFEVGKRHTYTDQEAIIAGKSPGIIHFTGSKPWNWGGMILHPLADEYWKYLKYTDFYPSCSLEFIFSRRIKPYVEGIKLCIRNFARKIKSSTGSLSQRIHE